MAHALVALGSNLGDRAQILDRARRELVADGVVRIVAQSRDHVTRPIGGPAGQGEFLNAAMLVEASLDPHALHARLKSLEADAGRERVVQWAARPLDLDLLIYDNLVLSSPALEIPHPRMAFRRFVLEPAAEVAPELRHPVIGWTIAELLRHLDEAAPYVAITGPDPAASAELAASVATALGAQLLTGPDRPTSGEDSPTLLQAKELEFIAARRRVLTSALAGGSTDWQVSGFWLAESLAHVQAAGWPESVEQAITDELGRRASQVVRPKLLVLIDQAGEFEQNGYRERLRELATRPGIGPLLLIEHGKQISPLEQVLAAVQAMS
jgi:2-amino-4-hydroxy-6-hydroxymethyldihydropteridine diphosphokinase